MIEEASLYGDLHVETSPVAATAVWTDHIATVRDVSLSRGGPEPYIGVNNVQAGSGVISLINNSATIEPGDWVKVRYQTTIIWAGYVQDINTTYTFIEGVKFRVKNLIVLDWVAWIAQWSFSEYEAVGSNWWTRLANINLQIDPTGANKPIVEYPTGTSTSQQQSKIVGQKSVAEVLDLLSNSMVTTTTITGAYWKANLAVPTGSTSGLDSLVTLYTSPVSTSGSLVDGTQTSSSASDVEYIDIEMVKQTSAVANNVVYSNIYENDGSMLVTTYQRDSATSVATYGSRLATVETAIIAAQEINLSSNPSFEKFDRTLVSANWTESVERPSRDSTGAWSAKNGNFAGRARQTSGAGTLVTVGDDLRIPVESSTSYKMIAYGAHSNSSLVRGRAEIKWYDDSDTLISTTYGSYVTYTSAKTWYQVTTTASSPATAINARIGIYTNRSSGAAFAVNARVWADAFYFGLAADNVTDYFDGDFNDTSTLLYDWFGSRDLSPSFRMTNWLYTMAGDFLNDNKNPKYSPLTIRVNAQDNLTTTKTYDLYRTVYVWFDSHRWTSVITGINHQININPDGTTRWMIELTVRPSSYTI